MRDVYVRVGLDKASPEFAFGMHVGALKDFVDDLIDKWRDEKDYVEVLKLELDWRSPREYY